MAQTIKWIVIQMPLGKIGTTGSYEIADATTILAVIGNDDGTVTVYYV